ncbi:MAG: thiamine diphosphokinase [Duncaniella sp.]|nr:thiamine diphosphokinase [Duncaniella sp.]
MNSILDFKPEAVIIDAGTFPTSPIPLAMLSACGKIVCCDGAADGFISRGYTPWRIVGDCDSLSSMTLERYSDIVRRFPDQETNDQTKAVRYLSSKGVRRIAILAATGKREDHTLGNITLLPNYLRDGIDARIFTDYGVFIPCSSTRTFHCPAGTKVSIFNFGATGMRSDDLRYPIRDFDSLWQGTLNETLREDFTIECEGPYIVFINYPDNCLS